MKTEAKKITKKIVACMLTVLIILSLVNITALAKSEVNLEDIYEFNGHYYKIVMEFDNTWVDAKEKCEKAGGYLACITSLEEQSFIEKINTDYICGWIGGTCSEKGQWYWISGEDFDYTNWEEGEPSGNGENCLAVWPYVWNDLSYDNLDEQEGFICEWNSLEDIGTFPEEPTEEEPSENDPDKDELLPEDVLANGFIYKYKDHYYSAYYVLGYTWTDAKEYCENAGGYLAVITDQEEQAFVEKVNDEFENLWIGGYRDNKFNWYWINGEEFNYTNWMDGEPNDSDNVVSNENRLTLWPVEWNDINENNVLEQSGFICEWNSVYDMTGIDEPEDKNIEEDTGVEETKPIDKPEIPTEEPTEEPTDKPEFPTEVPTEDPSEIPSEEPTTAPTEPTGCKHNWIKDVVIKEPSCTEYGEEIYICEYCEKTKTEIIPSPGHQFDEGYVEWEADCSEEGEMIYTCENCEYEKSVVIPKLEHTIVIDEAIPPTCVFEGYSEGSYCDECGETIVEQEIIPALGHDIVVLDEIKATYFETGLKNKKICTVCDKVISKGKVTPKLKLSTPVVQLTAGKKKITVKYSKVTGATAFQIKCKKGKKTDIRVFETTGDITAVISGLKKGKYKVQVRAMVEKNDTIVCSKWSKVKKLKVK